MFLGHSGMNNVSQTFAYHTWGKGLAIFKVFLHLCDREAEPMMFLIPQMKG
ncbi:hypothetical protein BPUM_3025 [Bacillus pumilus SAFR-032]|uniref:Uncharacterized protein n=1 Tax=Bacillus pumilus (strain SAFR-032) TaxID=315750 RepID=A8FHG2_BACP2|nr:hypothetical protein BPUM_3025 [Bacillus pumilus SAFR-032]